MAEIVVGSEATSKTRHVELRGTLATARLDDARSPAELMVHRVGPSADAHPRRLELAGSEPLALEMTAFVYAALSSSTVESDGRFGLAITGLLEAGEESLSRGGARVEIGSDLPDRSEPALVARSEVTLSAPTSAAVPGMDALA
jgi:predicted dehydrogenase